MHGCTGQDQFQAMCRSYYQGASGCCVLFDVTNQKSLDGCAKWKKEVDTRVLQANGNPVPSILLANKVLNVPFFLLCMQNCYLVV